MWNVWTSAIIILINFHLIICCIVPHIEKGRVVSSSNGVVLSVGTDYEDFEPVKVKCNVRYSLYTIRPIDNEVLCLPNKSWNQDFRKCQKLCKNSDLVDYTAKALSCKLNDKTVNCDQNYAPGTQVQVECRLGYFLPEFPNVPNQFTCLRSGKWNHPTYRCAPICGIQTPIGSHQIYYGHKAGVTEAPWNVAVYREKARLICGGTILTEKIILSAAHCFYEENGGRTTLTPLKSFKVVAGKFYRDFDKSEKYGTQIFNPTKIESHPDYRGKSNLNRADIAYVVLDGFIRYQPHIAPICFDYDAIYSSDREIVPGTTGLVVGWGKTETGEVSQVLKALEVPVVSYAQCKKEASREFLPFITRDKLCFGILDNSGTCTGDSGAGLVVPKNDTSGHQHFYLRGIVSIGKTSESGCDLKFYTLYTNVLDYIAFIQDAISKNPSVMDSNSNEEPNEETTSTLTTITTHIPSKTILSPTGIIIHSCVLKNGESGSCVKYGLCPWAIEKMEQNLLDQIVECNIRTKSYGVCCRV